MEGIFRKNLWSYLTTYRLKEIIRLKDTIKLNELDYKLKRVTNDNFSKYSSPIDFLRDVFKKKLTLDEVDNGMNKLSYSMN